jgi:sialic acid synthase SpsE
VLGAVTLGARIIEKHFTDDIGRTGPDHAFSMDPRTWREMIDRTRELENALGAGVKKVEENERETVVLQRRAVRVDAPLPAGTVLRREHLAVLRPCPADAIEPYRLPELVGRTLRAPKEAGDHLRWTDLA